MTTASARVLETISATKTSHRLESLLEAEILLVLVARSLRPGRKRVVAIETQVPVTFYREGVRKTHWFDIVLTYEDGSKGYYAVKKEGEGKLVKDDIKAIDNQAFATMPCFARYVTGDAIPKPQVNLAREFMRSYDIVMETELHDAILKKLTAAGGRATVHSLLTDLPAGTTYSDGWTMIYNMIGSGLINDDHHQAGAAPIADRSWVRFAKGQVNDAARAA